MAITALYFPPAGAIGSPAACPSTAPSLLDGGGLRWWFRCAGCHVRRRALYARRVARCLLRGNCDFADLLTPSSRSTEPGCEVYMLDVRKLAAIDIAFLGPRLIIAEFALGVFGSLALGTFIALRSQGTSGRLLAIYLLSLGVNYVPLLLHAISLRRAGTARAEIADELAETKRAMGKYRRGSLLLLLPFVVPALAVVQERRRRLLTPR